MNTSHIIVNPISGEKVTFLETAAETGGACTRLLVELSPNAAGPPLHLHRTYDETFTVTEGVLAFQLDKQLLHLNKGERCTAHAGQLHRFFNPSPTEKVSVEVYLSPGNPGFEIMVQVGFGLAADGMTNKKSVPKKIEHLALLLAWGGDSHMPGILFRLISPLMHSIARRASRKGVDKLLLDRYCRITPAVQPPVLSKEQTV